MQANLLKGWDADDLVEFDHRFVPAAVFTHPQIASVGGLTEDEARDAGHDITVKVQPTATSPMAGRWRTRPVSAR